MAELNSHLEIALGAPNESAAPASESADAWSLALESMDAGAVLDADADYQDALSSDADSGFTTASLIGRDVARIVRTAGPILLADLVSLAVSAGCARSLVALLTSQPEQFGQSASAIDTAPLTLCLIVTGFWLSGLYSELWLHPVVEMRQMTRVTTVALFAAAAASVSFWPLPLWCMAAWICAIILVPLVRTVIRQFCARQAWWGYPTLIIGSPAGGTKLAKLLTDVPRSGLRPCLITDPRGSCRDAIGELPVPGKLSPAMLRLHGIKHAVVLFPELSSSRRSQLLDHFSGLVPHLLVLSDASTLPTLWGASQTSDRISGIEVCNSLLLRTLQITKRIVDVVVSIVGLALSAPVLLILSGLIRLTDRGPALFGHPRIGYRRRQFKAWKLRTMYVDNERILCKHLANNPAAREEWKLNQKLRDDPRVTPIGRLMRRTSLDELPQLWNILRGDMSLVGPRPIVASEIARYGRVFRLYVTVKPGLTGLWQVSGRSNLSYRDRVKLDQFYVRHWSLWLDTYVIAKTAVALIERDGAH